VSAFDAPKATYAPHADKMRELAKAFDGTYLQNDAAGSGCKGGARWCVHATLVTMRPHDPENVDAARDYGDFAGRSVEHSFIDRAAREAAF
jgi:hypothetical protein